MELELTQKPALIIDIIDLQDTSLGAARTAEKLIKKFHNLKEIKKVVSELDLPTEIKNEIIWATNWMLSPPPST